MIIPCKFRIIFRPVRLKLSSTPSCTVEITLHALLYDWYYPARPPIWLILSRMPSCTIVLPSTPSSMVEITQHALKGQKLLAQGNALGIMTISNAPCKGKSFKIHLIKNINPLRYVKLLPLQGVLLTLKTKPRVLPWAKSFCPFRACCLYGLPVLQGVLCGTF